MTGDEDAMTQGCEAKCHTWTKTTKDGAEMTGQNDKESKMALVCFSKS